MQASKNNGAGFTGGHFRLRWSDRQSISPRELEVEIVRQNHREWVVMSAAGISEKTQVYLTGNSYMGNGIIQSCHREGVSFILTVAMSAESSFLAPRQEFDPGLLDIDNFLTEEEEAKILDSLKGEIPCSVMIQRTISDYFACVLQTSLHSLAHLQRKALSFLSPVGCV